MRAVGVISKEFGGVDIRFLDYYAGGLANFLLVSFFPGGLCSSRL
jgi:hypothetical protein